MGLNYRVVTRGPGLRGYPHRYQSVLYTILRHMLATTYMFPMGWLAQYYHIPHTQDCKIFIMIFLTPRRYGFVGQGNTVVRAVAVASGFGMLVIIARYFLYFLSLIGDSPASRVRSRCHGRPDWRRRHSFHHYFRKPWCHSPRYYGGWVV